jgi:polyphosphate glucokinase
MEAMTSSLGIDFGGTGIKGTTVDLATGEFTADRVRILTPEPSTPAGVAEVFRDLVARFDGVETVGVTVPGVVRRGVVESAGNIDQSWIGTNADELLSDAVGRRVHAINDADAAGLAEARYGAARGQRGLVIVTTLGTGIGAALLHDGILIPNAELGHVEVDGVIGEDRAANSVREAEGLTWEEWAARLTRYYRMVERLLTPELFVVGGGVSKESEHFLPLLDIKTPIVVAGLRNKAGIVGAALHGAS